MNTWVSLLSGALPEIINRTRPPMSFWTFLNTSVLYNHGAPHLPLWNSRSPAASPAFITARNVALAPANFACTACRTRSSTAGANTMNVGRRVGASPLVPTASFKPVSVSVCGLPYPIAAPVASITISAAISMMCASGRYARYTSLFVKSPACAKPAMVAHTLLCESTTPLGAPVVPDVYITTATSSRLGGVGSTGFRAPRAATSRSASCVTDRGSFFSKSTGTSPIVTQYFSEGQSGATVNRFLSNFPSQITTSACVWFTPCPKPSGPNVA
mmetsp:Transcript_4142/g.15196  ORF Transcript_4142/g.15196 Transcript_4142/m.15196 type:complete len:272 (+) Transcript_4142:855-1670(+)